MPRLPALNPIIAPDAYCTTCGLKMLLTLDRGPGKSVQGVWHECKNETSGCDYRVFSDVRLNGMATPRTAAAKKE